MNSIEFEKIKPQLITAVEEAILKAEAENPGGLQAWLKALSEGPKER